MRGLFALEQNMANLMPLPKISFTDSNGRPLVGGKVFFYEAGTNTPKNTFTDAAGSTPNTNPVILDARGEAGIWLGPGQYKVALKDRFDVDIWTQDYVNLPIYASDMLGFRIDSIAGLRTFRPFRDGDIAQVTSYYAGWAALATGPSGGGRFVWDASSTATDDGGSVIAVTGVATGRWRRIFGAEVSVKDFGAVGDGVTDDHQSFLAALEQSNSLKVQGGNYLLDSEMLGEFQKPLDISGCGAKTVIVIGQENTDKKAFRIGAVGGPFGDIRAVTKIENMTFKTELGLIAPWSYTAIDLQSTFPMVLKDIVFLSLGPDAVKITSNYYGYTQGLYFVNSGLTLSDVNVIDFSGGEFRADEFSDATKGQALFSNVNRYPVELTESDQISFTNTVFETWACPVIRLIRAYNTTFNKSWFEGNTSSHIIKMEQAQTVTFNDCQLDFAIPYTDCFIKVDNSIPNADENQRWRPFVRISGGYLLLMSIAFGDAPKFLKTTGGEKCDVFVDGVTFRGGSLYADGSVNFDVRSILLNGAFKHNFYSKPNASLFPKHNSWMIESVSADWDFATGANFTATAGLSVSTTTTAGEYMTGTRGVKVSSIPSDNTMKLIQRTTTGDMGEVTTNGQTYLVYVRVKCDQNVNFKPTINGGFADFGQTPDTDLPAGVWRDYVFKTQEDVTWAQGRFFTPAIYMYVTNNSGAVANFYIDRIDYQIVNGDHQI